MLIKNIRAFTAKPGQSAFAFLHQVAMAGYGFALLLILARVMPQDVLGTWVLIISALSISDMLMHGMLQTIVVKEISGTPSSSQHSKSVLTNAGVIAMGLYFGILTLGYIIQYTIIPSSTVAGLFNSWYPFIGVCMIPFNLSWWGKIGRLDFKGILFQRLLVIAASVVVLLIIWLQGSTLSIDHLMWSQAIGYGCASLVELVRNPIPFALRLIQKRRILHFLQYGKFTLATSLGSSLLRNADSFMISFFMGASSVAIYAIAQKVLEFFEVILRSVSSQLFPELFGLRRDREAFRQRLRKKLVMVIQIFLLLAVFVLIFAEHIIFWIGPQYEIEPSASILRVFMFYVLLLPFDRFLGIVLEVFNRPNYNLVKTLLLVIINLAGNVVTLKYFKSLEATAFVSSIALIVSILVGFGLLYRMRRHRQSMTIGMQSFKTAQT